MMAALAAAATLALVAALPAQASNAAGKKPAAPGKTTMDIQILSFNDFHGNLEPPTGSCGALITGYTEPARDAAGTGVPTAVADHAVPDAGGVAYLATHLRSLRAGHAHSITVAAGDLIGASPLLSAAFHDEPTIEAMNELGLEVTSVGNHEFDEGYKELQRMQNGGCIDDGPTARTTRTPARTARFAGANFQYLSANVKYDGHRPDDPAAVLDQELQRRQDRLHRHDPQGDPDASSPRPASPGWSSPTRWRPRTRWCRCSRRRASRRSSC